MMRHVFIVGSKGIPAQYGGFETFVENLTAGKKNANIMYHVSCMNNDEKHFYLTIPKKYNAIVDTMQNKRMVEDPRLTELQGFLEDKEIGDKVCSRMIWTEAFRGIEKNATKSDFKMISRYMNKFDDWVRVDTTITFEKYGKQKYWMRRK